MKLEETNFAVGKEIEVINDEILLGNTKSPDVNKGEKYIIKEIIIDSKKNIHLDIGLKSQLNYITSWDTKEELPRGDQIHWCHPSRFKAVEQ